MLPVESSQEDLASGKGCMIAPILQVGRVRPIVAKWLWRKCGKRKETELGFDPWFRHHLNWLFYFSQVFTFSEFLYSVLKVTPGQ